MNSKLDADLYKGLLGRLLITLVVIVCYRFGTYVPLPGVNVEAMQALVERASGGFLGVFNVFSGGALGRMTIFALSVMPYVVASIIMQLVSVAFKFIGDLKNEGDAGRRRFNMYSRLVTLLFCCLQGGVIVFGLEGAGYVGEDAISVVYDPGFRFRLMAIITLAGGTMLLLWLGDQISAHGIGNGISIIIFTGIVAEFPGSISAIVASDYGMGIEVGILFTVLVLCAFLFFVVVLCESSYRRVGVFYPRRQVGNRVYGSSNSHIPIKINVSGVMPVIFANSFMLFPVTLADFSKGALWADFIQRYMFPGSFPYLVSYFFCVVFFCFFYSGFVFNCDDIASSLKKNGGVVPGKRPGIGTANYLRKIVWDLTVIGSIYLALVCVVPEFFRSFYAVPFGLGGASFLIMVSVIMEVFAQIQSQILAGNYGAMVSRVSVCRQTSQK